MCENYKLPFHTCSSVIVGYELSIKYTKPSFRLQIGELASWPGNACEAITCFHVTNISRLWRRDFVVFHETLSQKTTTVQQLRLQECLLCSEKVKHVRHVVLVMSWSGLKGLDARLCRAKLQDNTLYKCILMCQYVNSTWVLSKMSFPSFDRLVHSHGGPLLIPYISFLMNQCHLRGALFSWTKMRLNCLRKGRKRKEK